MKKSKLAFFLSLMMLLSMISPVALAASPELTTPGDDPVEPDPYTYINYILIDLRISYTGKSTNYCKVYVPNTSCTCTIRAELQRKVAGASWNTATTIKTWNASGSKDIEVDEDWYVSYGYVYRLKATVDVYTAAGLLGDSTTVYSNIVTYP